jgi:uncharacterized protein CbrC (UPF0167 family)
MAPTFRYFDHPHQFSTYRSEPESCSICGTERSGYGGPFYGYDDETDFVCEECLASGRLAEHRLWTNSGDQAALERQLRNLQPPLDEEALQALKSERTDELERRTPEVMTWQDFNWPAHCGDYCRFVKEVGIPDLERLAPDGDGLRFFASHCEDIENIEHAREVWPGIRPDSPESGALAYDVGVYLFECLTCGETVLLWDCS